MFKEFDEISYRLHPCFPGWGINSYPDFTPWTRAYEKYYHISDEEESIVDGFIVNGVIAPLDRFYIPVQLQDKSIKYRLYSELTFYANDEVSFVSYLPLWKGIKQGKEVIIKGDPIIIEGKMLLKQFDTHIPVLVNCDPRQIPYTDLTFL